jgi:hypothetical protein
MSTALINPVTGPGTPLETERIVTPLGIRFWDLALDLPILSGLSVQLRLSGSIGPVLDAVLTRSGVFAFFGLPGLRAVEYPTSAGYGPPRTFTYVVTVEDTLGRYLPTVLVYTLDQTGAVLVNGTPDGTPGARLAYLFSAPARSAPPGFAAVTADLLDQDSGQPAAWAVINIQVGADPELWTGIADDSGRALVLVPFPVAQRLLLGSPPGAGQGTIADETWPLTVEVYFSPSALSYPLATIPDISWPWTDTPSLKDVLQNQNPAVVWSGSLTSQTEFPATLTLGQNLVLRTAAQSPLSSLSTLNISQGGSPP